MEPKYPVAVIGDDGLAEVHLSLDSVARSVEPPELLIVTLIDSTGQAFSLVEAEPTGWVDKAFCFLGVQGRYEAVPVAGVVPPEIVTLGMSALAHDSRQERS
jgi:hypothetical protein